MVGLRVFCGRAGAFPPQLYVKDGVCNKSECHEPNIMQFQEFDEFEDEDWNEENDPEQPLYWRDDWDTDDPRYFGIFRQNMSHTAYTEWKHPTATHALLMLLIPPNTRLGLTRACTHTHSDEFSMQIKAELQRVLGKGPAV